jgi:endo-1,4-beta-mannosidase
MPVSVQEWDRFVPVPVLKVDDVVLDGEEFEDEYGSIDGKSHMSHISQSTANSRRIETKSTNASLLQYSSRASSRSSEIEQGLETL